MSDYRQSCATIIKELGDLTDALISDDIRYPFDEGDPDTAITVLIDAVSSSCSRFQKVLESQRLKENQMNGQ